MGRGGKMTKQNETGSGKQKRNGDRELWLHVEQARSGEGKVGNIVQVRKEENNKAERNLKKTGRKRERRRRINSILSVHHVSLTLPVDPGPAHMSAHQCAYVSTIT